MRTLPVFAFCFLFSLAAFGQNRQWNVGYDAVDQTSLLEELGNKDKIIVKRIFPVPAGDILNVELMGPAKSLQYEIYATNGQMVKKGIMDRGQIRVDRLARSGYVLRLQDENKQYAGSWKFLKM